MLVKEHEDLYQAAISDTNKSMCGSASSRVQFYPPFAESNLFYRVAHLLPQAAHAHARLDTRQLQMLPRVCDKLI